MTNVVRTAHFASLTIHHRGFVCSTTETLIFLIHIADSWPLICIRWYSALPELYVKHLSVCILFEGLLVYCGVYSETPCRWCHHCSVETLTRFVHNLSVTRGFWRSSDEVNHLVYLVVELNSLNVLPLHVKIVSIQITVTSQYIYRPLLIHYQNLYLTCQCIVCTSQVPCVIFMSHWCPSINNPIMEEFLTLFASSGLVALSEFLLVPVSNTKFDAL